MVIHFMPTGWKPERTTAWQNILLVLSVLHFQILRIGGHIVDGSERQAYSRASCVPSRHYDANHVVVFQREPSVFFVWACILQFFCAYSDVHLLLVYNSPHSNQIMETMGKQDLFIYDEDDTSNAVITDNDPCCFLLVSFLCVHQVTKVQIFQFIFGAAGSTSFMFMYIQQPRLASPWFIEGCAGERMSIGMTYVVNISFLFLFIDFHKKTYKQPTTATTTMKKE